MIDPRTTQAGQEFHHLGRKVHVVAAFDDGPHRILTFKYWSKFRWNYEAERESLFLYAVSGDIRFTVTDTGRAMLKDGE